MNPITSFVILLFLVGIGLERISPRAVAQEPHRLGSTFQTPAPPSPAPPPAPPPANPAATPTPAGTATPLPPMAEVPVVPDRIVRINVLPLPSGISRFDFTRIEVTASQIIEVILKNNEPPTSGITHNWVLIKPGTEHAVAALGKQAGVDPDAVTYAPSILAATRTTRPGNESIVDFQAPDTPGEYPFISLVGEQRKYLHGVLVVKPLDKTKG